MPLVFASPVFSDRQTAEADVVTRVHQSLRNLLVREAAVPLVFASPVFSDRQTAEADVVTRCIRMIRPLSPALRHLLYCCKISFTV